MVAGDALVLSATEGVEVVAVELADDRSHIRALIICCLRDGVRRGNGGDGQFDWRDSKPLVGKDLGSCGMIDDH